MSAEELVKYRDSARELSRMCIELSAVISKSLVADTEAGKSLLYNLGQNIPRLNEMTKTYSDKLQELIDNRRSDCSHEKVTELDIEGSRIYECCHCHKIMMEIPEGAEVANKEEYL